MAFPLWFMMLTLGISSLTAEGSSFSRDHASDVRKCKLDLGLVVDRTNSLRLENLPTMRQALMDFVTNFIIGARVHVSFATFTGHGIIHNKFNDTAFHSKEALTALINGSLKTLSSPTFLDRAVNTAVNMFTPENGDRPGVANVVLFVTDGKTNPNTGNFTDTVKLLKAKGVRVYVIAYGPQSVKPKHHVNLKKVGGKQVYNASNYDSLFTLFDELAKEICPDQACAKNVVLVADKTASIGKDDFKLMKGFLLQISDNLIISPSASLVVVITFARRPDVLNTFNDTKYQSNEAMHNLIQGIDDILGNKTRTDRALEAVIKLHNEGGFRSGYPNELVVFTDGKTTKASKPYDQIIPHLKDDFHIVVVGIGPKAAKHVNQLKEISPDHRVHLANNFDDLSNLYKILMKEICSGQSKDQTRAYIEEPRMQMIS